MDFRDYVRQHLTPLTVDRAPEIVDELAQHLGDLYQEARADGLDHDAALARAAATLPERPEQLAKEIESASRALPAIIVDRWTTQRSDREAADFDAALMARSRRLSMLSDLRCDLRYAVRMLVRTPGFTLVVVLTLALGIGANAAIFSAVDALLLRDAPVSDPDRVVSVYTGSSDGRSRFSSSSYPDYVDVRDSGALEDVAASAPITLTIEAGGAVEQITGEVVSGNYFNVLGVPISVGRGFHGDEDRSSSPARVAVASYRFWQQRLGANSASVGQPLRVNGSPFTLIGVTPRGFTSPILGRAPDLFVPMALQPEVRPPSAGVRRQLGGADMLHVRGVRWLNLVGRLKADTTVRAAGASLDAVALTLERAYPDSNRDRRFTVVRLGDGPGVRASTRPLLGVLSASVFLVLLIACANVASLLAARAVSRRREVAIRMAVGAARGRLVRQWLTESVLLALAGSAGALLVAQWGAPVLYRFGIPESVTLGVNVRVLAFTLAAGVVSGLLFGLAPVLQALRRDTLTALRDEGGSVATGLRATRIRSAFVVLQVALSLMLLIAAGLFLRTLRNVYAVDLGYSVQNTLVADVNLDVRGYAPPAGQDVYRRLLERFNALPGVRAAGASRVPVLSGGARTGTLSLDGRPVAPDGSNALLVRVNVISDRYLEAMGIPILMGRGFQPSDAAASPRVAIVSRALATRLWPSQDPIGRSLGHGPTAATVIGVVPDATYANAIEREPPPFFYLPLAQNYESGVTFHIRTSGDPLALLPSVRQAAREIDPELALARPRTLSDDFDRSVDSQRLMATCVGLFGGLALLLAAIGLYGIMAHAAGQRRAEIGIRLALGARPVSILSMMIGQGLRLVTIGAVIGLAGAFAASRMVETQLFGVTPVDPMTYALVAVVLTVVAAAACAIPARRAMRVDPVVALRNA